MAAELIFIKGDRYLGMGRLWYRHLILANYSSFLSDKAPILTAQQDATLNEISLQGKTYS